MTFNNNTTPLETFSSNIDVLESSNAEMAWGQADSEWINSDSIWAEGTGISSGERFDENNKFIGLYVNSVITTNNNTFNGIEYTDAGLLANNTEIGAYDNPLQCNHIELIPKGTIALNDNIIYWTPISTVPSLFVTLLTAYLKINIDQRAVKKIIHLESGRFSLQQPNGSWLGNLPTVDINMHYKIELDAQYIDKLDCRGLPGGELYYTNIHSDLDNNSGVASQFNENSNSVSSFAVNVFSNSNLSPNSSTGTSLSLNTKPASSLDINSIDADIASIFNKPFHEADAYFHTTEKYFYSTEVPVSMVGDSFKTNQLNVTNWDSVTTGGNGWQAL